VIDEWLRNLMINADSIEFTDRYIKMYKDQYIDNGYGHYFTSEIIVTYNIVTDIIEEITIDGETSFDLQSRMDEIIKKCDYQNKFDECRKWLVFTDYEETEEQSKRCYECDEITMKMAWIEMIDGGGTW